MSEGSDNRSLVGGSLRNANRGMFTSVPKSKGIR